MGALVCGLTTKTTEGYTTGVSIVSRFSSFMYEVFCGIGTVTVNALGAA